MEQYKFIDDLTSDVMFEAYGRDLKEVFQNAAQALFSVICQVEKVRARESREVQVTGRDEKELLHAWLQELIALVDTEGMFFCRSEVTEISDRKLRAVVWGEEADPSKGETVVKAVTYYKFGLEKGKHGYVARAALDI
jgi:SHS2 domain-containing protein